jgi:hypothetical protein
MSWSIIYQGDGPEILKKAAASPAWPYIPAPVKEMLTDMVTKASAKGFVHVESNGHVDSEGKGEAHLKVYTIDLVMPGVPIPEAGPAAEQKT